MSFGMELIFMLVLGILILGPKRLHTMLAHVARAKAELENATRGFKSQLAAEFDALPAKSETDGVLIRQRTLNIPPIQKSFSLCNFLVISDSY